MNTGFVSSTTLIVCDTEVLFPQSSVATKVLMIVNSFTQFPGIVSLGDSTTTAVPQLSTAVGVVYVSTSSQLAV